VLGDLSLAARVQFTAPEAAEQFAQRARAQLAESTWLVQRSSVTVRNNAALIEMVATFPEAARMIEASAPLP